MVVVVKVMGVVIKFRLYIVNLGFIVFFLDIYYGYLY